jgi:hypothetical protein
MGFGQISLWVFLMFNLCVCLQQVGIGSVFIKPDITTIFYMKNSSTEDEITEILFHESIL